MPNLKNKHIVVTGGLGYIGSALVRSLLAKKAKVTIITNKIRITDFNKDIIRKCSIVINGLRDEEKLRKILRNKDIVFHLAGNVPYLDSGYGFDHVLSDIKASSNLAKASIAADIKKFVFISGWVVYGKSIKVPIKEENPALPLSLYGMSKLLNETVLKSYLKDSGIQLTILRAASVYGKDQPYRGLLNNFCTAINEDSEMKIVSDIKKDNIYVDDMVVALIAGLKAPGIFNIGAGKSFSPLQIKKILESGLGRKIRCSINIRKSNIDDKKQKLNSVVKDNCLDITKARKLLGFAPKYDIFSRMLEMINKKLTLFVDLDGTLLDINDRLYRLHLDICKKYEIKPMKKNSYIVLKRSMVREKQLIRRLTTSKTAIKNYLRERAELIELPGYLKLDKPLTRNISALKKLKKTYRLILLTNRKNRKDLLNQLKIHKLLGLFFEIYNAGYSGTKEHLLRKCRYLTKDSYIIGDTVEDALLGKKLGVKAIIVLTGLLDRKNAVKLKPAFVVNDLRQIFNVLNIR